MQGKRAMNIAPIVGARHGRDMHEYINLETREVSRRVFVDKDIYDAEMERIFGRSWVLLGHETEIPKPGDYVVRNLGADSVIMARDSKGAVHVSLNICPHRGMRVCAAESGNSTTFVCSYHGWAFRPDGRFVGAPVPQEQMHGDICDKLELGLTKARVTLYGGLVFACWSEDAPSFDDFMGEYKFYMDLIFNRTDSGIEVLGPPQRCIIESNWKVAAEQFACDGYHTLTAHRSMLELGFRGEGNHMERALPGLYSIQVGDKGHGARCINPYTYFKTAGGEGDPDPMRQLAQLPPPGLSPDLVPQLRNRLSADQIRLLATRPPSTGCIFPNVGFLCLYLQKPNGKLVPMMNVKTFFPKGIDRVEFLNWFFAEKDASQELKDEMRTSSIHLTGVSGLVEQDDGEVWGEVQRGLDGPMGRRQTHKYQALLGENKPEGWPGGGHVYAGFNKDDTQWNWWRRWAEVMGEQA
jgi:phenylpropionate dioxygenase-like ring-hydroxylating dioxygenase large terminal subunit